MHEHASERVAGAETADDFDEVRRHDGVALSRRDHHTFATHLDDGQFHAALEQPTRSLWRIAGADGHLAFCAVAERHRDVVQGYFLDGKTLTITTKGTDENGRPTTNIRVYDKQ